jgi:hypothetical protein
MMFHNDEGNIRYCITSYDYDYGKWDISGASLSGMKYYDREFDRYKDYLDDVSSAFEKLGVNVSADTLWNYFNLADKGKRSELMEINPEEAAKTIYESFVKNMENARESFAENNIQPGVLQYGNTYSKKQAINLITENDKEGMERLQPFVKGDIAKTADAVQTMGVAIIHNELCSIEDKTPLLNAHVARVLGMEDDMLEFLRDEVKDKNDKNILDNYLKTMRCVENDNGGTKLVENHVFKKLRDGITDALVNDEYLNPKRMSHSLQLVMNRIRNMCNAVGLDGFTQEKATANILSRYMREPDYDETQGIQNLPYGQLMECISYEKKDPEITSMAMHFIEAAAESDPLATLNDIYDMAAGKNGVIEPAAYNMSVTELQKMLVEGFNRYDGILDEKPAEERLEDFNNMLGELDARFNREQNWNEAGEPDSSRQVLDVSNYPDIILAGRLISLPDSVTEGRLYTELKEKCRDMERGNSYRDFDDDVKFATETASRGSASSGTPGGKDGDKADDGER